MNHAQIFDVDHHDECALDDVPELLAVPDGTLLDDPDVAARCLGIVNARIGTWPYRGTHAANRRPRDIPPE